jgi:hypothetical protein
MANELNCFAVLKYKDETLQSKGQKTDNFSNKMEWSAR